MLEGAPDDLVCPISFTLMTDPVVAMDGNIYQRSAIEEHIEYCREKGMGDDGGV